MSMVLDFGPASKPPLASKLPHPSAPLRVMLCPWPRASEQLAWHDLGSARRDGGPREPGRWGPPGLCGDHLLPVTAAAAASGARPGGLAPGGRAS